MGRQIQYKVSLSQDERTKLEKMSRDNSLSSRAAKRVLILLALDGNNRQRLNYRQIAAALHVSETTVSKTAKDFAMNGLDDALAYHFNPASLRKRKVTGELEACVIQLACGKAPEGYADWTLELLTQEANKKGVAEPVCRETVRLMLKKNELKPWLNEYWCIPPKENAEFVACMEDVLHVYSMPYNPDIPVICMDEKPYQLLGEAREPLMARPGDARKLDSEYVRNGGCSIFVFTETLAGYRHVSVREHRTKQDWAEEVRTLLTEIYPDKEKIILVMDNLNTHTKASLYQAFPAEEAAELANRLEIHYTPKHGSWLDIAEIELNAMSRQCLDRRISSIEELRSELAKWECDRNGKYRVVDWQFTAEDARVKLKSLYPKIRTENE